MKLGDTVRIVRPRYPRDGKSAFLGKLGQVKSIKGRCLSLRVENVNYMFWVDEVTLAI